MLRSITSPAVSIKNHTWQSGSWSQDKNLFSTRLLSSPSFLSAAHFRPSVSCPNNNQSVSKWDTLDDEDKPSKLRIDTMDYPNLHVSLSNHNDWSEKFIQSCIQCFKTKNNYTIQITHPARLIDFLEKNCTENTLRVKIILERSKGNQCSVNNNDWPIQLFDYDCQSNDDSSSVSSIVSEEKGEEKEYADEDEDIFVDGMEELEETDYNIKNGSHEQLVLNSSSAPPRFSRKSIVSIPSPPIEKYHLHSPNKVDKIRKSHISLTSETQNLPIDSCENSYSASVPPRNPKIIIPEGDPVAIQKAYPLFTQYIKPDILQPTTIVQSPCRDNGHVTIKKLDVPEHPMGAFLVESTWRECSVWDIKAIVESVGARKIWDNTFETSSFLHSLTPNSSIWHTKFKGAWPVSSRDYICFQGQYTSPHIIDLISTSCIGESYQHKSLPKEISGYNRATMDISGWRLERLDGHMVSVKSVLMTHFSTWVINYFTSRYIEQSLASVRVAKEYLDLYGAPPSIESLTNAMLIKLNHDHDRKTWRCEYNRRTESETGDKATKVIPGTSTISSIRIDKRRWASLAGNKYSIIIDPPPSHVNAVYRSQDPYGVWLTIEHDEVFIIPFHGKILAIIKPDDAFSKDPAADDKCQVFVNGSPIIIGQEEKSLNGLLDEESEKQEIKPSTNEVNTNEEEAIDKAIDELAITPKKHAHAAQTFLKQADEQFGWSVISDKNGTKVSKRSGTKNKKKEVESPFVSAVSKDGFVLDVPEPFMIYRASKVIEDFSAEEITAVVSDLGSVRKSYDDTIESIEVLRHIGPGYRVIRQTIKSIFPFKSREAYTCSCLIDVPNSTSGSQTNRTVYFESSIPEFPVLSTKKSRGNLFMSAWIIEPIDPYTTATNYPIPSTRVTYVAALDLGHSVPSYISNLVVNNWFPKKIHTVHSYLKSNGAPPFISEPVPSLQTETTNTPFRWESIDCSYDKISHHYYVTNILKILSSEISKRPSIVSKRKSIEIIADKLNGNHEGMDVHLYAADKALRCGSLAQLPKKRVSTAEVKDRPLITSRALTFLQTTIDLRSYSKGYTIQVQLFDITDENKKRNISDKLTLQISEPISIIPKNDHIKHTIHIKTMQLSPSVLPAIYRFEFNLLPILEENREKTPQDDLNKSKGDSQKTPITGIIIVNGEIVDLGKEIKIKKCAQNEENLEEIDHSTEISGAQGTSEIALKEGQELQETFQSDTNNSIRDTSSRYTSSGVVAAAFGNVSAGVNVGMKHSASDN